MELCTVPRATGDNIYLARRAYMDGVLAHMQGKRYDMANNLYLYTSVADQWAKGYSDSEQDKIVTHWMAGDRISFDGMNWHARASIFDFFADVAEANRQGDNKYICVNDVTWSFEVREDDGLLELRRV